jgi:hypothetical protein
MLFIYELVEEGFADLHTKPLRKEIIANKIILNADL